MVKSREKNGSGKTENVSHEIDFIATGGSNRRYYIQSAYMLPTPDMVLGERRSLIEVRNQFPKIIVRRDTVGRWYDDDGIMHINLVDFLLDDSVLK